MINTAYFLAITLVFLRLATFFMVVKVFYPSGTPKIVKGALAIIISLMVVEGLDLSRVAAIENNYMLIMTILNEILCGLVLGFCTELVFQVVQMAGGYLDIQVGLSMMSMMNPTSKASVTILANITYYMAAVLFFIIDGHHVLIKCLVSSFNIVPLGQSIVFGDTFNYILQAFVKYFIIGVRIAIPIIIVVLISDICMSLISRTVPAINVMILGMPVRMVVGLLSLAVFLPILVKIIVYSFNSLPDVLSELLKSLSGVPLVFLIFAKDDRTEEATPKKKKEARDKGQIAKSKDVGLAITMMAITLTGLVVSSMVIGTMRDFMKLTLHSGMLEDVTVNTIGSISIDSIVKFLICVLPVALPIMVAGVVASLMQTGLLLTGEPLKPKFSKLNPISGFKNMFSMKSLADLAKNLVVVTLVAYIGYQYVMENYESILQISNIYLPSLGEEVKTLIVNLFMKITILLVVIAAADYFIQFRLYNRDLKMTKQEVKEEYKQMEGDPQLKSKIKQKQREMATRRMMSSVADATVVITNPTHLAIAILYEDGKTEAPKVVAKGADLVALKIKEIAKENDVPIMENKPLARLMYDQVEIDQEIPQDMYQAVAEILAVVFKLKNKK